MKKFVMTMALMVTAWLSSWAYDFVVDNIYYNITSTENLTCEVTHKVNPSNSDHSYTGNVVIPATVTNEGITYKVTAIGDSAFWECQAVTSITLPEGITSIGKSGFNNCFALPSITIPTTVTSIGAEAFRGCIALTSFEFPEGITMVGDSMFYDCWELKTVTFPSSVVTIGNGVFRLSGVVDVYCNAILPPTVGSLGLSRSATLHVPVGSVDSYKCAEGWTAFSNIVEDENIASTCAINGIVYGFLNGNKAIVLANSETPYTGDITIPSTVAYNEITYNVTKIGDSAFNGCTGLTSITIPSSVTTIGVSAFSGCTGLTEIHCDATIPPTLDGTSFDRNDIIVYVPEGCKDAYKSADGWSSFTTIYVLGEGVEFTDNGLCYISTSKTEVTLVANSETPYTGDITIPSTVAYNEITYNVTKIGDSAFNGCTGLTSVTIPSSVTSVGAYAFSGCTNLKTIDIPEGVTFIGPGAFSNCSSLESLTIPGSLLYFHKHSCTGCSSLKTLILSDSENTLNFGNISTEFYNQGDFSLNNGWYFYGGDGSELFVGCPIETLYIGRPIYSFCWGWDDNQDGYSAVFAPVSTIKNVTFSDKLTSISDGLLQYCSALTSVAIPNSVTSIGDSAFSGCSGLTSITIPKGVASIGEYAFYCCSGLTSITIPSSVTSIGGYAFHGCNLNTVILEDGDTELAIEDSFADNPLQTVYLGRNLSYDPNNGYSPFDSMWELKNVTISDKVTTLGDYLFWSCGTLSSITIPSSVTAIGAYAFSGCSELKCIIELSGNVTSIGENAFSGTNCQLCKVDAVTPPTAGADMFNADALVAVIVPAESVAAYKAAEGWSSWNILKENVVEVTVSTPGNLGVDVVKLKVSPKNVTKLIVHGEINESDFNQMRENMTACSSFDLSDATCDAIPAGAFQDKTILCDLKLPSNCTSIGDNAFSGCNSMDCNMELPSGLTSIGSYAFKGTAISGKLTIPASVTTINSYAFSETKNLKSVVVASESVLETIGEHAFSYSASLDSVDMSAARFTMLPNAAFRNCGNLASVLLPDAVESIGGEYDWEGALEECTSLGGLELPDSLKTIGSRAFYSCRNLDNLEYPAGLTTIYADAFSGCAAMTLLDMTDCTALTSLGDRAFENCTGLTTVNLPSSLTSVGSTTFGGCKAMANITVPSLVPPTSSDDAFYHVDNYTCLIATPTDSWIDYVLATPWGAFMEVETRQGIDVTVGGDDNTEGDSGSSDSSDGSVTIGGKKHHHGHVRYDRDWHKHHKHHNQPKAIRNNSSLRLLADEDATTTADVSEIKGYVNDGLSLYVQDGDTVSFLIEPEEGYEVKSVLFGNEDVTSQLTDGVFTTPAVTATTPLVVTFGKNDTTTAIEAVGTDGEASVSVSGSEIIVNGLADGAMIEVYSMNGALVYKGVNKVITIDGRGVYIVRAEGAVKKVLIK